LALLNRLTREGEGGGEEVAEEGCSSSGGGGGGGEGGEETKTETKTKTEDDKTAAAASPSSPSDASVRLQLAVLRHLVPPLWTRKTKYQPVGGDPGGLITGWHSKAAADADADADSIEEEEDVDDDDETARGDTGGESDEVGGRKRFRQDWMPKPWDVDR
jgi:hypothetical protein